jgi:hypothetical protein
LYEAVRCSDEVDVYRHRLLLLEGGLSTVFPCLEIRNKSVSFSKGHGLVRLLLRSVYRKSLVEFFAVAGSVLGNSNFLKMFAMIGCVVQ